MATLNDVTEIAGLVIDGATVAIRLVREAMDAARAGDEATALAKLDEANVRLENGVPETREKLKALRASIPDLVRERFDTSDAPK